MKRLLPLLIVLALFGSKAHADIASGFIAGGGYNIYTNDAFDDGAGVFIAPPYFVLKNSVLTMLPGSLGTSPTGISATYVNVGGPDMVCDVSHTGAITYNNGHKMCGGTAWLDVVSGTTAVSLTTRMGDEETLTAAINASTTTALGGKAALLHTHAESDVSGLIADLAAKASDSRVTGISNTVGALQSSVAGKANAASLSTVAFSGGYSDLSGKPSLATVATTGSYNDLSSKPSIPTVNAWTVSVTLPTLTTSTGAAGFQLSSTRNATYTANVNVSTATQIGVASNIDGYVVMEIAATNSSTAGDWMECSRSRKGQNIGLAIALALTLNDTTPVSCDVPAGYYAKVRTVNTSGTPTYSAVSGLVILK